MYISLTGSPKKKTDLFRLILLTTLSFLLALAFIYSLRLYFKVKSATTFLELATRTKKLEQLDKRLNQITKLDTEKTAAEELLDTLSTVKRLKTEYKFIYIDEETVPQLLKIVARSSIQKINSTVKERLHTCDQLEKTLKQAYYLKIINTTINNFNSCILKVDFKGKDESIAKSLKECAKIPDKKLLEQIAQQANCPQINNLIKMFTGYSYLSDYYAALARKDYKEAKSLKNKAVSYINVKNPNGWKECFRQN